MTDSPVSHESLVSLNALLSRLDSLTTAMQNQTKAINALAKSNAQIADALLEDQGTLDVPDVQTL